MRRELRNLIRPISTLCAILLETLSTLYTAYARDLQVIAALCRRLAMRDKVDPSEPPLVFDSS